MQALPQRRQAALVAAVVQVAVREVVQVHPAPAVTRRLARPYRRALLGLRRKEAPPCMHIPDTPMGSNSACALKQHACMRIPAHDYGLSLSAVSAARMQCLHTATAAHGGGR